MDKKQEKCQSVCLLNVFLNAYVYVYIISIMFFFIKGDINLVLFSRSIYHVS